MPGPIQRNVVVKYFGQPDRTEGSVNEPREREEHGFHFNEKWTYVHPRRDPVDALERTIYWHRYDYVGSVVRRSAGGEWQTDASLQEALGGVVAGH